jgi:hypothetical protein
MYYRISYCDVLGSVTMQCGNRNTSIHYTNVPNWCNLVYLYSNMSRGNWIKNGLRFFSKAVDGLLCKTSALQQEGLRQRALQANGNEQEVSRDSKQCIKQFVPPRIC